MWSVRDDGDLIAAPGEVDVADAAFDPDLADALPADLVTARRDRDDGPG